HGAAAGGVRFGQLDKSVSRSGEQDHLFGPAAQVEGKQREHVNEFEGEVAVAGRVDTVRRRAVKTQLRGHGLTIDRECRPSYSARSQWTKVRALAAVGEASGIAEKHFHIRQQPMRED